ncbi:helix-turn-helix transcriptional regulator [Paraburkholderia sp. LEh10]|uniref:helix-turn-helix domain-containing protein n=1 Tax=Paraburkholderia sp. LEh10 TaxID=2821353 RepID=UPI001AE582A2|nr:AraC family transcriptional regulator [Paraburkholderia sp. LEh10]MBP0595698.1 helix-turn-helix transcriptional regulator [Paraburkholderia sp. LEh10]
MVAKSIAYANQELVDEDALITRFRVRKAPTLSAAVAPLAPPITISRLHDDQPRPGRSLTPQLEEAFVFQIPLIPSPDPEVRYSSGHFAPSEPCRPGWCYLLDLSAGPTCRLDTPFDNIRLYISQMTIDELAYQNGRRRTQGLIQTGFGACDPILFHMSQVCLPVLENPGSASALFVDQVALAVCEHVVTRYGRQESSRHQRRTGLAPWQMRRIVDFLEANLGANPSILDLARQCELSASYFAEAFRQSTGVSPHQWLLRRRIERAKSMLRNTDSSLASIALDCGFFDQSHFSRVFARLQGCAPKDWRRRNR